MREFLFILEFYTGIIQADDFFAREQQKRLAALQMELGKASQEGFVSKHLLDNNEKDSKKKLLAVIGVSTNFGNKKNRDAIRKAWMPSGLTVFFSPLFLDFFW